MMFIIVPRTIGDIIPPTIDDFTFFENAVLTHATPVGTAQIVIATQLNTGAAVDCSTASSPIERIIQLLLIVIDTAVQVFVSVGNAVAKVSGNGDFADAGDIQITLNMFKNLIIEDRTRTFCRIGLGKQRLAAFHIIF
jgi:hypothetical protein